MNRKHFLWLTTAVFGMSKSVFGSDLPVPETLFFKDDGIVPNSKYPLLLYRTVFSERSERGAEWLEQKFHSNAWSNLWRNGIFTFQHYHSIAHEVLGIYSGEALVLLGGEKGSKVKVKAGDIIVIPAGVGHKNLQATDLGVVGGYPNGMAVDILRCEPGDRPKADSNITAVPFPQTDPLLGEGSGLRKAWK
jgi:uncharacterized protein YjlB